MNLQKWQEVNEDEFRDEESAVNCWKGFVNLHLRLHFKSLPYTSHNPQIILIICGCFRKIFGIIDARKRRILCI